MPTTVATEIRIIITDITMHLPDITETAVIMEMTAIITGTMSITIMTTVFLITIIIQETAEEKYMLKEERR